MLHKLFCCDQLNCKLSNLFHLTQRLLATNVQTDGLGKKECDVAVIGGGIIGTAIARKLKQEHNNLKIVLIEKECSLAKHQSSHNSGVMHCGVYYKPGSLKAKFSVEGIEMLQKYCDDKNISYKKCGKLIVAKNCAEAAILDELFERGRENKVKDIKILESQCEIQEFARGCRGIKALRSSQTANVDFKEVTRNFFNDFSNAGGETILNTKVTNIETSSDCDYPLTIISEDSPDIQAKFAITCGGLQSEYLTNLLNDGNHVSPQQKFISLKVDYLKIKSRYCDNLETNIYPVPDLDLPFLGAHLSPLLDDSILLGPYAVPALKIEGYGHDEISLSYVSKVVASCGFRNMLIRNFSKCVSQFGKAICCDMQIKDLQEILPNFSYQFVEKGPTAVQCQLLNQNGTFVDDFVFDIFRSPGIGQRIINVKFTPSPAATSSMAIANYIVEEFESKIQLS